MDRNGIRQTEVEQTPVRDRDLPSVVPLHMDRIRRDLANSSKIIATGRRLLRNSKALIPVSKWNSTIWKTRLSKPSRLGISGFCKYKTVNEKPLQMCCNM
jgi:hypothetical protein